MTISTDDSLLKDMSGVVYYPAEHIVQGEEALPGVVRVDGSRAVVAAEPGAGQRD